MIAQRENFHQTLGAKDADKDHVKEVQYVAKRLRLLIVVHGHRQHVEANEQHDDHVEFFVRHNFEHDCLGSPLWNWVGRCASFECFYLGVVDDESGLGR